MKAEQYGHEELYHKLLTKGNRAMNTELKIEKTVAPGETVPGVQVSNLSNNLAYGDETGPEPCRPPPDAGANP